MIREMLTTRDLAEYLDISEKHVYRLVNSKRRKIPGTRITGKWLFPKNLIDEWIISDSRKNVAVAGVYKAGETAKVVYEQTESTFQWPISND